MCSKAKNYIILNCSVLFKLIFLIFSPKNAIFLIFSHRIELQLSGVVLKSHKL